MYAVVVNGKRGDFATPLFATTDAAAKHRMEHCGGLGDIWIVIGGRLSIIAHNSAYV